MGNFENMPLSKRIKAFYEEREYVDPKEVKYAINADFLIYNCYEECTRELYVSFYPMLPLLEKTVPIREADYILYSHCYARIKDTSNVVLNQIRQIAKARKPGAEIIVVGKSANIEHILNGEIDNITFWGDHFTEKLGEKFDFDIKEEYFVYDDIRDVLNIWPVDGCNKKCAFCRRTYMDIKFESIPLDKLKAKLDYLKEYHPEQLKHINLRAENLTEYGIDIYGSQKLHELIDLLDSYDEIETISFPIGMCIGEITPEILDALCRTKKIDLIYLNIETGSDRLLKVINKGHDKQKCLDVFHTLKQAHPDLYIISNIMIGLPTEEIIDMYELADLVCNLDIDYLWINYYGMAENQPLAKLPQISQSLREYHLKIFLDRLLKREDNPLQIMNYPRILDKNKRQTYYLLKSLKEEQKLYDNGVNLSVTRIFHPESKKLRKEPTLRF